MHVNITIGETTKSFIYLREYIVYCAY